MLSLEIFFKKKPSQSYANVTGLKTVGDYLILVNSLDEIIFGVNLQDLEKVEVIK